MKASELVARCLENEGVRYVFGVPGEEILDIVNSLVDSSVPNGLVEGQKDPAPKRELRRFILEQLAEGADDERLGQLVCPI